jgi:hypothetical protein
MRVKIEDKEQNPYPPALLRQAQHIAFPFKRARGAKPPRIRESWFLVDFPPFGKGGHRGDIGAGREFADKANKISILGSSSFQALNIPIPQPYFDRLSTSLSLSKGKGEQNPRESGNRGFWWIFPPLERGDTGGILELIT